MISCISVAKAKVVAAAQSWLQLWSVATMACVIRAASETLGSCAQNAQGQQRQVHRAWEWSGTVEMGCFVSPVTVVVLSAVEGTASRVDWEWAFPGQPCFAGSGRAGGPELPLQWERGESLGQGLRKTLLLPQRCLQGTTEEALLKIKF